MVEMNGKLLREELLTSLKEKVNGLDETLGLCVIQVGNDEASNVYVHQKEKLALEMGYKFIHKVFPSDVSQDELLEFIDLVNDDETIDGILVQMPLPSHLDETTIQNRVSVCKDVDGLSYLNAGKLNHNVDALVPCTPKGIIDMLDYFNIPLEGKNAVVIGRSVLVGKPIASLLTNRNATVTICHSKTVNIENYTRNADIIVVAIGKAGFLTKDMVKEGAVVVDVGINRIDGKLYGDVKYDEVKDVASYITPVPGGVGPMTVYELMANVYEAHGLRTKKKIDENERKLIKN